MRGKNSRKKKTNRRKKRRGKMNHRGGTRRTDIKSRENRKRVPIPFLGIV